MSEAAFHDVALWIGGRGYAGWSGVSIDCGIDAVAGGFELQLTSRETTGGAAFPVAQGAACRVTLAGQALITGYIDRVSRAIEAQACEISVTGRDKAADLVDCAPLNSPGSWTNASLETIARAIAAPFGIAIAVSGSTGAPFTRFALQQGETAFAAIERMTRYRGLIAWSLGDGTIHIGNPADAPGNKTVIGRLVEGMNVLAAQGDDDGSQRFSSYIVKGQASGSDQRSGAAAAQVKGEASDPQVTRYRPMLVIGEEQASGANLRTRAAWEARTRAARGQRASVTVQGWFVDEAAETIWRPGALAACSIPSCAISGTMLIERVRFARSAENGTTAELTLVPPEAWAQLAEPEPKA